MWLLRHLGLPEDIQTWEGLGWKTILIILAIIELPTAGLSGAYNTDSIPFWMWAIGPLTIVSMVLSEIFSLRRRVLWEAVTDPMEFNENMIAFSIKAAWILLFPGIFALIGFIKSSKEFKLNPWQTDSINPLNIWPTWVFLCILFMVGVLFSLSKEEKTKDELTKFIAAVNKGYEDGINKFRTKLVFVYLITALTSIIATITIIVLAKSGKSIHQNHALLCGFFATIPTLFTLWMGLETRIPVLKVIDAANTRSKRIVVALALVLTAPATLSAVSFLREYLRIPSKIIIQSQTAEAPASSGEEK